MALTQASLPVVCESDIKLLVYGFVRKYFDIEVTADDIINLCLDKYCVTYRRALDIFLNQSCCAGVYDHISNCWRTALYINHWEHKQRIMVAFKDNSELIAGGKYRMLDFPVLSMKNDVSQFFVSETDLRHCSNVPTKKIDEWVKRNGNKLPNVQNATICTSQINCPVRYIETNLNEKHLETESFIMCRV